MKTSVQQIAKALLLGVCVSVSSLAVAQSTASEVYYEAKPKQNLAVVMYPASDPSKLWLVVEKNLPTSRIYVEIKDNKDKVVYQDWMHVKSTVFRQRLDLSQLTDGVYTFKISDGKNTQERSFKLATPGITEQLPKRHISMN